MLRRRSLLFFLALQAAPSATHTPAPELAHARLTLTEALERLPGRTTSLKGSPGDALNLVLVGNELEVLEALEGAGWTRVPRSPWHSILAGAREFTEGRPPAAFPPMEPYKLYGRLQDYNFSIPIDFPDSRHHFRLWRTPYEDVRGRPIWTGSADYDVSVRWSDLSHVTDPAIDRERDFVAWTLRGKARLSWVERRELPRRVSDGRALLAVFD